MKLIIKENPRTVPKEAENTEEVLEGQASLGGLYIGDSQWNGMTLGTQEALPLAIPSGLGRPLKSSLLSFLPVSS